MWVVVSLLAFQAVSADEDSVGNDSVGKQAVGGVNDPGKFERVVAPFLDRHCAACHLGEEAHGDLQIDRMIPDLVSPQSAGRWIEVMDQLNLGQMPPDDQPRPDVEQLRSVTAWIAAELRHAERSRHAAGGRVLLRRLNRDEYTNTIRDLLEIEFLPGESPRELLPPDGTAEGFDKVATALMLDPSLLEKYFEAATLVANKAIVEGPPPFPTERMRYELEETLNNRAIRYLCAKPGIECRKNDLVLMQGSTRSYGVMKYPDTNQEIPIKGMYRIRVRAWSEDARPDEPVVMRFQQKHPRASQQRLLETEVTDEPRVYEVVLARDPKCGEYNVSIVNGSGFQTTSRVGSRIRRRQREAGEANDYEQVMRLQSRQQLEALTWGSPNPQAADVESLPKLVVDWIECEGPLYEQWPPKSHQKLLFRGPGARRDEEYVVAIFERFMHRAFRGPVSDEAVSAVTRLVVSEMEAGESFHDAIRAGIVAVLCSPRFLYLIEPDKNPEATASAPAIREKGSASRPLSDWEIASRLSYFLWSSMPDERLFLLASQGRLRDHELLRAEVDRMLADPRSTGFVDGFAAQWLKTDEFLNFTPDARLYPRYDEALGTAMVQEPLAFFAKLLHEDLPVTSLIDADWTMANQRLAEFYGITGIEGEQFRPVELPDASPRGGLLGMAGVALRGSDGNRTKPVHRGVYVRDVFFNAPPDPPPPNAGEVEPNIQGEKLTVRQRLEQHQEIASCAACHRGIDGYGFALENFNAIGAWRDKQDGEGFRPRQAPPIDASGELPNGQAFDNFVEFKSLLMSQEDRFARGLSEKLLTYALGRSILPSDRPSVDRLSQQLMENDFTLRGLIKAVVTSEYFLNK